MGVIMLRRTFLIGGLAGTLGAALVSSQAIAQSSKLQGSVVLGNVTGGTPVPSSAFLADLTPRRFRDILQQSIEGADLASRGGNARYRLDAHVEHVDYPSGSFIPLAVTVRSIVRYNVVDLASNSIVLSTRTDETAVVTRLQVADELARANAAIKRSAHANAQRAVAELRDSRQIASR
jgi:hypothetical protein